MGACPRGQQGALRRTGLPQVTLRSSTRMQMLSAPDVAFKVHEQSCVSQSGDLQGSGGRAAIYGPRGPKAFYPPTLD